MQVLGVEDSSLRGETIVAMVMRTATRDKGILMLLRPTAQAKGRAFCSKKQV